MRSKTVSLHRRQQQQTPDTRQLDPQGQRVEDMLATVDAHKVWIGHEGSVFCECGGISGRKRRLGTAGLACSNTPFYGREECVYLDLHDYLGTVASN